MKVEFSESDVLGAQLLVTASEFKKAIKSEKELESLVHATTAFSNLFGTNYEISREEYSTTVDFLDKESLIIFRIGTASYPNRQWVEILASTNNQLTRICWSDGDGYHLKRARIQGQFDPAAMERIRKLHEGE